MENSVQKRYFFSNCRSSDSAMSELHVADDYKVREMLTFHAQKLVDEKLDWRSPCAYIMFADSSRNVTLDADFIRYSIDDAISAFETEHRSVQWLMEQITKGCDHAKEFVAGIVLPDGNVVSHVFPKKVKRKRSGASTLLR